MRGSGSLAKLARSIACGSCGSFLLFIVVFWIWGLFGVALTDQRGTVFEFRRAIFYLYVNPTSAKSRTHGREKFKIMAHILMDSSRALPLACIVLCPQETACALIPLLCKG